MILVITLKLYGSVNTRRYDNVRHEVVYFTLKAHIPLARIVNIHVIKCTKLGALCTIYDFRDDVHRLTHNVWSDRNIVGGLHSLTCRC